MYLGPTLVASNLDHPEEGEEEEAKEESIVLEVYMVHKEEATVAHKQQEHRLGQAHAVPLAYLHTTSAADTHSIALTGPMRQGKDTSSCYDTQESLFL